jgi:hypothetical protein
MTNAEFVVIRKDFPLFQNNKYPHQVLSEGTMDNAFQKWLDDSTTSSEFQDKAVGEIPTVMGALGAGIILAIITGEIPTVMSALGAGIILAIITGEGNRIRKTLRRNNPGPE